LDEIDGTDGDAPVTRDEMHQMEERVNARFQAVNARFVAVDGRFAQMGHRVGGIEEGVETIKRYEKRFGSIDNRLDEARTHVDHLRLQLSSQIDHAKADMGRIVLLGLLGTVVCTAALCLGTIVLLL
jgi:hypothetical protein